MAAVRFFQAVQTSQKGAFTGSGRSANHDNFTGSYLGRNIYQGLYFVGDMEGFVYVLHINHDTAILFSSF